MMDFCLICLRHDKKLTVANKLITKFHAELCNFSESTISGSSYCNHCCYLLTKFYKFREKCKMALKKYQTWLLEDESIKVSINTLYLSLPPSSLDLWVLDPKTVGYFVFQTIDSVSDTSAQETINNADKSESNQIDDVNNSYDDTISIYDNCNDNLNDDPVKIINSKESHEQLENNKKQTKRKKQITGNNTFDDAPLNTDNNKNLDKYIDRNNKKPTKRKRLMNLDILPHDSSENIKNKLINANNTDSKNVTVSNKRKPKDSHLKESLKNGKSKKSKTEDTDNKSQDDTFYETMFDIEYLTSNEMRIEEFERRKTYECYLRAEYKCDLCNQPMKSKQFLEYHKQRWHTERPGQSPCAICKIWSAKSYIHRRMSHYVVCKCKLCPLVSYQRRSMKLHIDWHNGKQYRCEPCAVIYRSLSAYRTHTSAVHRPARHVCVRCGRGFRSGGGLRVHQAGSMRCLRPAPPGAASVRCERCDVTLPSQKVYDAHMRDVHTPRRRRVFTKGKTSDGLPRPVTTLDDSGGKPRVTRRAFGRKVARFECRLCKESGGNFNWLKLHFKNEHPSENMDVLYADKKKHLCHICGLGFSSIYGLRDHMHAHTGARPYACDLCPLAFRSQALRAGHRRRHFPGTHVCDLCGKTCKSFSNLHSHVKSHIGEKNYKCDICSKAFLSSNSLNEHVRGVHFNKRRKKAAGAKRTVEEVAHTPQDSPSQ